jgi:hypothetical protein
MKVGSTDDPLDVLPPEAADPVFTGGADVAVELVTDGDEKLGFVSVAPSSLPQAAKTGVAAAAPAKVKKRRRLIRC